MELLDRYATSYPPVVVGLLECVVLMWVYGYTRFSQDVWYMFGKQPGRWWRLLWQFVTPALLLVSQSVWCLVSSFPSFSNFGVDFFYMFVRCEKFQILCNYLIVLGFPLIYNIQFCHG